MEGLRIGIDLGTTNTCCYYEKNGNIELLTDTTSSAGVIPSYVDYKKEGRIIVGSVAKKNNNMSISSSNVLHNTKRAIGKNVSEICGGTRKEIFGQALLERNNKPVFHITALDKDVTPGDVASEIVKEVIRLAEARTDMKVTEVCITVPANFGHNERVATLQAVMSAGIPEESIHIQNEPTAAAICYGVDGKKGNKRVLVYDFGGGTFDVSILEINDGTFNILTYEGINDLGGVDIDTLVLDLVGEKFFKTNGIPLFPPEMEEKVRARHYRKLLAAAEETKINLQDSIDAIFTIPYVGEYKQISGDEDEEKADIELSISQSELNAKISTLIDDTMDVVDKAIERANFKMEDIDKVLLVGGSSRLRLVREKLEEKFGKHKISVSIDPDHCVARGACLQLVNKLAIHDVLPYSLGKVVNINNQAIVCCLAPCREKLPKEFSLKTQPIKDYLKKHYLYIVQGRQEKEGDRQPYDENEFKILDVMSFDGFEEKKKEDVVFETTFEVKANGMLYVSVNELKSNTVVLEKTRYTFNE